MTTEQENDQSQNVDDGDLENEDSPVIRALRKQLKEEQDARVKAQRENAFNKAGIDTSSKAGQFFFDAYKGEIDPDSIKAEATEIGIFNLEQPGQQEGQGGEGEKQKNEGPNFEAGEEKSTREREALATGAAREEAKGDDPRKIAMRDAEAILESGGSREDAIGEAFGILAEAGYKNQDARVLYRGNRLED